MRIPEVAHFVAHFFAKYEDSYDLTSFQTQTEAHLKCSELFQMNGSSFKRLRDEYDAFYEHRAGYKGANERPSRIDRIDRYSTLSKQEYLAKVVELLTKQREAVFFNGVYENVFNEILQAQEENKDIICYLQPYKSSVVTLLRDKKPSEAVPITAYFSVTSNLNNIEYIADVIGWEDKREISKDSHRMEILNKHISKYQPNEEEIYLHTDDDKSKECVNLISIKNLRKIKTQFSVKNLIKTSDNTYCKPRSQAGGWSYVQEVPLWTEIEEIGLADIIDNTLENEISKSQNDSAEKRLERLKSSPKKPSEIQIISKGFKRNADVIVEVLKRAKGVCERCQKDAPFLRKKDNTPYLEVHHKIPLAENGDDTVDNSIAVCPNCHRELHFGA